MGNGYTHVPDDEFWLRDKLVEIQRRLAELESMDGSQIYNTVQDLKNLVAGLLNQVDGNFTGNLTVGGTSTLNVINSLSTYSRNVTGSGSYRVMYVNLDGSIGYVPSSRKVKQDIRDAVIDTQAVLAIPLKHFRYIAAVDHMGDDAPVETGVIAEEVAAIGDLDWLIDYGPDGDIQGFKYDRLALALLGVVQNLATRMDEAGL